ncbi:MAG: flagellar motor protein MotB [Lachnospiraceae bacterium]|nr:flagellar motor protein MotB [Lachnospiraceae bacterium]
MARQKKTEEPPKGAPAWQSTFADLMNLLLCFFVLLYSMSTIDAEKFDLIAASFNQTFSIFSAGATAIGDGILISNGVSQLNELDQYINSTGKVSEGKSDTEFENDQSVDGAMQTLEEAGLQQSEETAEIIEEAITERNLGESVDIDFTAQYVELTLKGSLLFAPGSAVLREDVYPVLDQIGVILERYSGGTIEIEGHTDNVPMSSARYANNNELSDARALSVFDYLVEHTALNPADIKHSGRGEYKPVADNSTEEGRAKNRRVEIRIYNSFSSY